MISPVQIFFTNVSLLWALVVLSLVCAYNKINLVNFENGLELTVVQVQRKEVQRYDQRFSTTDKSGQHDSFIEL